MQLLSTADSFQPFTVNISIKYYIFIYSFSIINKNTKKVLLGRSHTKYMCDQPYKHPKTTRDLALGDQLVGYYFKSFSDWFKRV